MKQHYFLCSADKLGNVRMRLKNYNISKEETWTGRIDDVEDRDAFRMHQIVQIIDLEKLDEIKFNSLKLNVCFVGFCSDEGVRRNLGRVGAKDGPRYIRKQFANLPMTFGNAVDLFDAGDICCPGEDMEGAQKQLELAIELILAKNVFPIVLGGGHEVAFGHYSGISNYLKNKEKENCGLGIVNFDAHFDLRPFEGVGSSGTMFSQIANQCEIENSPFSYMCLGIQTSANTVSMFKKADDLGVKYILAKDIVEPNFEHVSKALNQFIDRQKHIYLTICSDLFNAANAPGVSAQQPFGMNPEVVLKYIKEVLDSGKVISLDIAEVSPRFDHDDRTAKLAAVIIYAVINKLAEKVNL